MTWNHLAFRLLEIVDRKSIYRTVLEFERMQFMPPDEARFRQFDRLRTLVAHAYATAPFYRQHYDASGFQPAQLRSPEDLVRVPLVTKELIKAHKDAMISSVADRSTLTENATGGSTGQPMKFYLSRQQSDARTAAAFRNFRMVGWDFLTPTLLLAGAPIDISRSQRRIQRFRQWLKREYVFPMFGLTERDFEDLRRLIISKRPSVVMGYTSALYLFAQWVQRRHPESIRIPVIIQTAEKVESFQIPVIESGFQGKFYKHYGAREMIGIGIECPCRNGMHANGESLVVEIIRDGRATRVGEPGEIVLTDLYSQAMPLIRYKIGDLGTRLADCCDCGRNSFLFEVTEGRVQDIISTADGRFVSAVFFPHLFKEVSDAVERFQVVQRTQTDILIKVVRTHAYSAATEEYLRTQILRRVGETVVLTFEYVSDIPPEPSGKFRWTRSEVPVSFGNEP